MLHISDQTVKSLLLSGRLGLEKESLRIDGDGFLSQTTVEFNDPGHIVRDFSENQVEVNTPVTNSPQEAIDSLEHYNAIIQKKLSTLNPHEYLWPFSNPPYIRNERDIPVAKFYGDDEKKMVYREYLSDRYGRYKMAFSGIHFNYSFNEDLLRADYEIVCSECRAYHVDPPTFKEYRTDFYVRLAEKAVVNSWIIICITAASPVMDSSFVEKGKIGGELFQGLAPVRCS
ncbi:MAG: hypothetical protein LUB61_01090, partial [Eggerthellaceae bacterium]|nr:hypothetical protein [Eggerthellaceae bacterium]